MTLQSLHIKRFQAHEDFFVEFDPYLTVISGVTDSGKSSILRALQWCVKNQPSGESFIRNGEGSTEVALKAEGKTVTRRRNKTTNTYELDGKLFEAFGMGCVPDEIESFLNLSEVSFQNQLDPHFWLSKSAGEVSRELNAIINLGMIDRTMSVLSKQSRDAKSTATVSRSRLEAFREQRDALNWIEAADASYATIELLQTDLEETRQKRQNLQDLLNKIIDYRETGEQAAKAASDGQKVIEVGEKALGVRQEIDKLTRLLDQIKLLKVQAGKMIPQKEIDSLEGKRVIIEETRKKRMQLQGLLDETDDRKALIIRLQKQKEKASVELNKLTGGRCPICNGEMK